MGASLRANISKTLGATSAKCSGLKVSLALSSTPKILGLRYPYWDRGGAKVVKLNENFKIVAQFLCP